MSDSENKKQVHLLKKDGHPLFPVTYTDGVFDASHKSLSAIINDNKAHQQVQDNRISENKAINKRQDMDLKCLFAESKNKMIDVIYKTVL